MSGAAAEGSRRVWRGLGVLALTVIVVLALVPRARTGALVGHAAPALVGEIVAGPGAREGDRFALADHAGRPVLVEFWASWCAPCRLSAPALSRFAERHPEVAVIAVNVEGDRPAAHVARAHAAFRSEVSTLHDATGTMARAYGIDRLPTLIAIDAGGSVVWTHTGPVDDAWLEAHVVESSSP